MKPTLADRIIWWLDEYIDKKVNSLLYPENENPFTQTLKWMAVMAVLIPAIVFFGGIEWVFNLFQRPPNVNFKECLKCRDGFDMSTQPFYNLFCPNCHKLLGDDGMKIVDGFLLWATRTHPRAEKSDKVALSVFNALTNNQPREKLIEALQFYTSTDLVDLMFFSMLLEEYDDYLVRRKK